MSKEMIVEQSEKDRFIFDDSSPQHKGMLAKIVSAFRLIIRENMQGAIFRVPVVGHGSFKVTIERETV